MYHPLNDVHVPNRLLVLGRPGYYGTQMRRGPPADADARANHRTKNVLGSGHDLLMRSAWKNVPLAELVGSQLAHLGDLVAEASGG
jgi:hypothetical protein